MPVDLTGGLDPSREYLLAEQPDDPQIRESVNAWIWDGGADVGLPRIGVEAVGDQWETHEVHFHLCLADGRIYGNFGAGPIHDPLGADGQPRTLGAGPIAFELVEPFRHWRVRYDGMAVSGSVADEIGGARVGGSGDPDTEIQIELDLFAAVPPWENGALREEARRVLAEQDEGRLMGHPRIEQLNRATGIVRIGTERYTIDGGALRIRRRGTRHLGSFRGHAWQSALFPDGRGFGYIVYPPRDDGLPTYNEGYVFDGDGELIPARVVDAPWLRRLRPPGEPVAVVLETERGETTITGETLLSSFSVIPVDGFPGGGPALQQSIVRYHWDGQVANGMLERSTSIENLEP